MSSSSVRVLDVGTPQAPVLDGGLWAEELDDDGNVKRTGTLLTASAHIITAVIGSGVLSLAWANAQLGWVAGPVSLLAFSAVTLYTSILLADCYRHPVTRKRNAKYMEVVRSSLGRTQVKLCALAQYVNLVGVSIGYTITGSISMVAVQKSNCFHKNGHKADCHATAYPFMAIFAAVEIILSQLPNFHNLAGLSILAAVMSFTYASIGIGLSAARIAEGADVTTTLTGTVVGVDVTRMEKVWRSFQALGNIAFAYTFSNILIEIQDTLKSSPPENQVMKKATLVGVITTTVFYMLCGSLGYAAFGNNAPGNFLTGFGFYEPYWLIDLGNICIVVHLIGAYQVFSQPIFQVVEEKCLARWPKSSLLTREFPVCGNVSVNLFRLLWRTAYVVTTGIAAMIFPFFNDVLGLIGALAFYPLTVYFPVEMYLAQSSIPRYSAKWVWLKILCYSCLVISIAAALGSIQGLVSSVQNYRPFRG